MIVDLPDTTTAAVNKKLIAMRNDVGAMATGRVLTLVVPVPAVAADQAIADVITATKQHPSRIVVVIEGSSRGSARLDAEIRVGGDAGASEILVLHIRGALAGQGDAVVTPFLLPDSPIVVWWPAQPPRDTAADPIGRLAHRRVTDAASCGNPQLELRRRSETYVEGDTDLAWSRITRWRGLLAAALDEAPYEPVTSATVVGAPDSPSADLLAAWLAYYLKCPVRLARADSGQGLISVRLDRAGGPTDLVRPSGDIATMLRPGTMSRRVALAHRSTPECLADELRRLDPDEIYEATLRRGLPMVDRRRLSHDDAVRCDIAPSPDEARKERRRTRDRQSGMSSAAVAEASPEKAASDSAPVKKATRKRLAAASDESTEDTNSTRGKKGP